MGSNTDINTTERLGNVVSCTIGTALSINRTIAFAMGHDSAFRRADSDDTPSPIRTNRR
jgi:hypothetical protein